MKQGKGRVSSQDASKGGQSAGEKDSMVSLVQRLDRQIKQYRDESGKSINDIDELYGESVQIQ